jgi:hypothetical protein
MIPGKHEQLGIANKTRRQPITTTLGKLYVVALFISPHSSRQYQKVRKSVSIGLLLVMVGIVVA